MPNAAAMASRRESALAGEPRVLVVEDESLVCLLIEETVAQLGWQVVGPAARLGRALELVRTAAYDCAVLDVNLRGEPVYPVAEILAEQGVPFLFLTGYSRAEIDERFRGQPMIRKPFTGAVLYQSLRRLREQVSAR